MDNKGYVMGGMAFLLIIPALILANILASAVMTDEVHIIPFKSDKLHQLSGDVESNIPLITLQILNETSDTVSRTGEPVPNSKLLIKSRIQTKIDETYREYQRETGINVTCKINSVDNSKDPYKVCVTSTLYANYREGYIAKNMSQEVQFASSDFTDSSPDSYKIKDPLPFIIMKGYGSLKTEGDTIYYGAALSNYLKSKGINNSTAYNNASSPLYFKRCPYDPYPSHGHSNSYLILKNCIENGYYHLSAAGSCIFCRLEGKPVCNHTGLETFVVPGISNFSCDYAPCSVDHVIFGASPSEIYLGKLAGYDSNNPQCRIFLDKGHKDKYGLPND
ncbi:MAG: hypothetical protein NKF70_06145 [Methanobacterium sp. ERen5]|nr:MAG: hypothetical protein NKF70_06145 [Methanobacterium sp. ERen5]